MQQRFVPIWIKNYYFLTHFECGQICMWLPLMCGLNRVDERFRQDTIPVWKRQPNSMQRCFSRYDYRWIRVSFKLISIHISVHHLNASRRCPAKYSIVMCFCKRNETEWTAVVWGKMTVFSRPSIYIISVVVVCWKGKRHKRCITTTMENAKCM